ncbi:hypothetical protein LVB87_01520 [Lysobacter sp. KIS68-7]|uniref:hypothetical protein n=1 Tax=Lysobacter sp. KIS68-7 TaxID=2904252 RepID=UPI001E43A332|nr:hypothetical protein [Lysobacter sp. KIS68-7]UHQ19873.1 hypothetical protein LVB87_01520 [Lysobacter sp. KIS68-7]
MAPIQQAVESAAIAMPTIAANIQLQTAAPSAFRACGCPYDQACTCTPRLRILDPTGKLLMMPVYY